MMGLLSTYDNIGITILFYFSLVDRDVLGKHYFMKHAASQYDNDW